MKIWGIIYEKEVVEAIPFVIGEEGDERGFYMAGNVKRIQRRKRPGRKKKKSTGKLEKDCLVGPSGGRRKEPEAHPEAHHVHRAFEKWGGGRPRGVDSSAASKCKRPPRLQARTNYTPGTG